MHSNSFNGYAFEYVDSLDVTLLLCAVPEREVQVVRLGRHAILPNVGAREETPSGCSMSFLSCTYL